MTTYTITRIVERTEEVEVEADSQDEAWRKAEHAEFTSLDDKTVLSAWIKESRYCTDQCGR